MFGDVFKILPFRGRGAGRARIKKNTNIFESRAPTQTQTHTASRIVLNRRLAPPSSVYKNPPGVAGPSPQQTMPRFDDSFVPLLKSTLLQRMPDCLFTSEDVDMITRETGLSASQIQRWAKNIRYRHVTLEERDDYLSKDTDEKVCFFNWSNQGLKFWGLRIFQPQGF